MVPDWLQQLTRDFGARMGLAQFGFNDRGVAGFKAENGFRFQLEHHDDRLFMSLVFPMAESTANWETLLEMVHPEQRLPYAVHAAYKAGSGGVFLLSTPVRELSLPELMHRFECLWKLAGVASRKLA